MHNKKLILALGGALLVVLVLMTLSYNKERSLTGGILGGNISKTNPAGTYIGFLRAADTAGRTIILQLGDDASRTATMSADYNNVRTPIVDRGTWSSTPDGFAISLTNKNGLTLAAPEVLAFTVGKTTVQLVNPDRVTWGSEGVVLSRSPLQLPSEWAWQYTTIKDGTRITARTEKLFTASFTGENRVSVRGDCNSLGGTFGLRHNNGIVFSELASTRMFCEGSQEAVFTQDLSRAIAYRVSGNSLTLTLPNESGTMTFARITNNNVQ